MMQDKSGVGVLVVALLTAAFLFFVGIIACWGAE
jgi:hypothetical protein